MKIISLISTYTTGWGAFVSKNSTRVVKISAPHRVSYFEHFMCTFRGKTVKTEKTEKFEFFSTKKPKPKFQKPKPNWKLYLWICT